MVENVTRMVGCEEICPEIAKYYHCGSVFKYYSSPEEK
jgi:hypothetical protein